MNVESTLFSTTSAANQAPRQSESRMHMDDFFRILTTQLTSQDPLKPIEDKDFISQMATFSNLQQMEILSANFDAFRAEQQFVSSQSLLGKIVRVEAPNGEIIEGAISRIERGVDGKMAPFVGDYRADYNWITAIREAEKVTAEPISEQ